MRIPTAISCFVLGACSSAVVASATGSPATESAAQPDISATVQPLASAPRKRSPAGTGQVALLARGRNAFVGRIELAPNAKIPEHRDPTEEYVFVLEGEAAMYIDGTRHDVHPGDTIFMPANALVHVDNGAQAMIALQVFAGPASADKYDAWASG